MSCTQTTEANIWFVRCNATAVRAGQEIQSDTSNEMGVVETLFSTAVCGVIYAVLCGQPLVIVGVTGPIVIFTNTVYGIAKDLDVDFLQFYSWIGML